MLLTCRPYGHRQNARHYGHVYPRWSAGATASDASAYSNGATANGRTHAASAGWTPWRATTSAPRPASGSASRHAVPTASDGSPRHARTNGHASGYEHDAA